MVRPMSCAIQIFGTVIQPVAGSTSASTTQAVYEYAGEGPTPAPLKRPGARGGRVGADRAEGAEFFFGETGGFRES